MLVRVCVRQTGSVKIGHVSEILQRPHNFEMSTQALFSAMYCSKVRRQFSHAPALFFLSFFLSLTERDRSVQYRRTQPRARLLKFLFFFFIFMKRK